jgi:CO/xanthine dehydrogenase FAD-binding subunit
VDLNTVVDVVSPAGPGQWRPGDAWLGGGTALFAAADPGVTRLLDLAAAGWPALTVTADGLEIAATCTIAELAGFTGEPGWSALHGLRLACCQAFLASFKIWNVATVGGNLCAALDGTGRILTPDGGERWVRVADVVTGDGTTVLADGELLRSVHLPLAALTGRTAYRKGSLHALGRSAVLLAGRLAPGGGLVLTVTAATARPYQLRFTGVPGAEQLSVALTERIPPGAYLRDVHGSPVWRRHLTRVFAEQIRQELAP